MTSFTVFIVESPGSRDFLDGRREGESLSKILSLSGISNRYMVAIDETAFRSALELFCRDFADQRARAEGHLWPVLHLSCHGNEAGLVLSNGDIIGWTELRSLFDNFNLVLRGPSGQSFLAVCLSACYGLYARQADVDGAASPFAALVGSDQNIEWADALVAYAVFYHNLIYAERTAWTSVQMMNDAIGHSDLFKIHASRDYLRGANDQES